MWNSSTDNGNLRTKDQKVTILTDVILVNVSNSNEALTGQFKWQLYEHFQIESSRYENEWEFEEYVRLAEPAYAALQAIIGEETTTPVFVISHEFMGMPLALKVLIERKNNGGVNLAEYAYCLLRTRSGNNTSDC